MTGTGFQRSPLPPGNSHIATTGAAKNSLPDAAHQDVDEELLEAIADRPELPTAPQSAIGVPWLTLVSPAVVSRLAAGSRIARMAT